MNSFSFNLTLILTSATIALQSNSWVVIWLIIEINIVGIIIQLTEENNNESIILFLIFQSLPAIIILTYVAVTSLALDWTNNPNINSLIILSMVCNIGLFPLHNWMLNISNYTSWVNNFIIISWQNIIPMVILINIPWDNWLSLIAIVSIMVMTLTLVSTIELNCFIMASSLVHISWISLSILISNWVALTYLSLYSIVLAIVVSNFANNSNNSIIDQIEKPINSINISIISLAGLPPMAGFIGNIMVLAAISHYNESNNILALVLIAATTSLYAYLQVIYNSIIIMKTSQKNNNTYISNNEKTSLSVNMLPTTAYYAWIFSLNNSLAFNAEI